MSKGKQPLVVSRKRRALARVPSDLPCHKCYSVLKPNLLGDLECPRHGLDWEKSR